MTTTILLSGGGALGAFQAGALAEIQDYIDAGVVEKPSHAFGISVGALNAALCSMHHYDLRWVAHRWRKSVREPEDIAIRKSLPFRVLPGVLRNKFDGLVDPSPLRAMIDRHLDLRALAESPIQPRAGAVHLNSGALLYATPDDPAFFDYLMASAAIPAIFPAVVIDGEPWADGGLVEVAPATRCIKRGADHIIVILCYPEDMEREPVNVGNPWALAERLMDIVTTSSLEKDVRGIEAVNHRLNQAQGRAALLSRARPREGSHNDFLKDLLEECGLSGKRHIKITMIRPSRPLKYNTGDFGEDDIYRAINAGKIAAREALGPLPSSFAPF